MGGVIDSGVGISSTPSPQQSSDLEKTQAELRQTFTAAEKFRRELEFLQKGGDPLDLKAGSIASVSVQSTSLTDQHPEPFVTSEAKGSFAIAASPHGDSVESSGRLGAPSVCEPNSADNLMLFDGDIERLSGHPRMNRNTPSEHSSQFDVGHNAKESGESAALELPKKSYKRRIRSRPNRKNVPSNSHLEIELDGTQVVESTLGPVHGPYSAQENQHNRPTKPDGRKTPLAMASTEPESIEGVEQQLTAGSEHPPQQQTTENVPFSGQTNGFQNMEQDRQNTPNDEKGLDFESSCTKKVQNLDGNNGHELPTVAGNGGLNGTTEHDLPSKETVTKGNDLGTEKGDKISNIAEDNSNPYHSSHNDDVKEEEGVKESQSASQTKEKLNNVLESNATSPLPVGGSVDAAEHNVSSQNDLKVAAQEREDSILEEARIIEAKRKRIAQLSVATLSSEKRQKSHWDFVLEEMSWLANDFAQERLWKVTAAAHISRKAALTSLFRFQQQTSLRKLKEVAHTLAEAVVDFWNTIQAKCKESEPHCGEKDSTIGVQGYAIRFLEYNSFNDQNCTAQVPMPLDDMSDLGIFDNSWEDNLTEENLFYTVPPGAIEAYRKSIESHLLQCERTGSSMQEEVDTSGYDTVADFGFQDNAFDEDEGATSTYYLPGAFEGSKSSKSAQKKRKHFKLHTAKSYNMGPDSTFMQSDERNGKRPAGSLNVSIPTKRVRTASRQRVISPFNVGSSGCIQGPNRADGSSGDTNSFQDEQSTLHGGSHVPNNMEAESVGDYEKQLHFDSVEVTNRPKKKKKAKHTGSTYDHRWQLDSSDHKDHLRRRLDAHQFDSNGSNVASQMSNMSNPNKFMKLLVRDRGRKAKALKNAAGPLGSGSPWSLFEDQALVVLVHDMGPNWELISDAINSTLQFKCIFRKSNECKERHKILMDRNTGEGADSAEDSGSSQPYPSTLPGIPEGSARQLFQRLQGPMEEDTLKSHFEKLIMIGQKQHYRRTQNDNQDPKQLQQPHGSHTLALSQVCPNNLKGGPVLTPLELCDAIASSPDLPVAYQGSHSGGLPMMNHGTVAPMLPGPASAPSVPSSSNLVLGSNLPSSSAPLNPSVREGRYGIPRSGSLSLDDQQRMQQYNQMISARHMQQSGLPPGSHSVTDRGVRMLPAGSGMGVTCGMNRSIQMARPSFHGIASPSMNSGPAGIHHSGAGPGQGNSMLRPRDAMHIVRPNQNTDRQKIMPPDVQGSQGGPAPPFGGGINPSFPNQASQPAVQSYPHPISPQRSPHMASHHFQGPPGHPPTAQHPAYGMRFVKERQLQQQRLLQQQQLAASTAMVPAPAQPPESQIQSQSSSSPPIPKHPVLPPHVLVRNQPTAASGSPMVKQQRQRQSQQFPPPDRRQQVQSKLMKGGGRGAVMTHQNLPAIEPPLLNGFSGGQSTAEIGGNLYPAASAKLVHQQKTFSGELPPPQPKLSHLSGNSNKQNHHLPQPPHPKPASQSQPTNVQKALHNRKPNPSEPESPASVPMAHPPSSNDAGGGEPPAVSSAAGAPLDNATQLGKSSQTSSEHSGPAVSQGVVHRQSSSDSLPPNPGGHDAGRQWRQQKQPSS